MTSEQAIRAVIFCIFLTKFELSITEFNYNLEEETIFIKAEDSNRIIRILVNRKGKAKYV